jgi:hypothetical protein
MIEEKSKIKRIGKRIDTQLPVELHDNSRTTEYWKVVQFREMYKRTRPGFFALIPKNYDPFDQEAVINHFDLKGFEYGNWLNQEDRYNYLMAVQIALFDLSKITGIKKIGLGKLVGISFGARGSSKALAHFEASTNMINITRFHEAKNFTDILGNPVFGNKTTDTVKSQLFVLSGGIGSLAHEYGHALDYIFGGYVEADPSGTYRSLTNGWLTNDNPVLGRPGTMRHMANSLIYYLMYDKPDQYTAFYAKLKKAVKAKKLSEYWIRHSEMFARAFESYIQMKLRENGISNTFLTHLKYVNPVYPDPILLKKIEPLFDKLIKRMAVYAK